MIGAGNVAFHLAPALKDAGYKILQVFNHTKESAKVLAGRLHCSYTNNMDHIRNDAGVYILALTDTADIEFVSKFSFPEAVVVHTSGGLDLDIFKGKVKNYGVIYPVQTFSKFREVDLRPAPVCLEASNPETEKVLFELADRISDNPVKINSKQRLYLHIAAVFACNFVNHMYVISSEILRNSGLPFSLLQTLIKETAEKVVEYPPLEVQTGPALRNDQIVIEKHLDLLSFSGQFKKIYRELSDSIHLMKHS